MTRPSDTPFRTFFLGRLVPEQQQKLARGLHSKIQLSNLRLLPTAELALGEPISMTLSTLCGAWGWVHHFWIVCSIFPTGGLSEVGGVRPFASVSISRRWRAENSGMDGVAVSISFTPSRSSWQLLKAPITPKHVLRKLQLI